MGKSEEAIDRARRALRLSPFDSLNYLSYQALSGANFHLVEAADARWRQRSLSTSMIVVKTDDGRTAVIPSRDARIR
jgi:hypothetical protein